MGHLIPMAFNNIIIILIGNAHPWALMGKNVTVIGKTLTNEKVKRDRNWTNKVKRKVERYRNCMNLAHLLGIHGHERDRNYVS